MNQAQAQSQSFFAWALKKNPGEVTLQPLYVKSMARKNDRRPAKLELFVDDDWILNMGGVPSLQDVYAIIRIDGTVFTDWKKQLAEERLYGKDEEDESGQGRHLGVGEAPERIEELERGSEEVREQRSEPEGVALVSGAEG